MPLGFVHAAFNNLESVASLINERTVAIMVEPVQGEGGVIPATKEFMQGVRKLCDEKDLLMLCDDIQSGLGRTGQWFGFQHSGIQPDAFTLAKSLAAGVPMGALVASPALSDVFQPGSHGSTFGGNPMACAAAMAVLDVIEEEGLVVHAAEAGLLFREGLQAFVDTYDKVLEVRGEGLIIGLAIDGPAKDVVDACRTMGLLCCTASDQVVRFLPPLNVKDDELEEALEMVGDALEELYKPEAQE